MEQTKKRHINKDSEAHEGLLEGLYREDPSSCMNDETTPRMDVTSINGENFKEDLQIEVLEGQSYGEVASVNNTSQTEKNVQCVTQEVETHDLERMMSTKKSQEM